jgi:hypothetical protein
MRLVRLGFLLACALPGCGLQGEKKEAPEPTPPPAATVTAASQPPPEGVAPEEPAPVESAEEELEKKEDGGDGFNDAKLAVYKRISEKVPEAKPASGEITVLEEGEADANEAGDDLSRPAVAVAGLAGDGTVDEDGKDKHEVDERPARFLPRSFYFQNTYLGGSVSHAERMRRLNQAFGGNPRPYDLAYAERQKFDAPESSGMALDAALDKPFFQGPGRVYLQVGLQGSEHYGWRRPPLDAVLLIDEAALVDPVTPGLLEAWLDRLQPEDRLAVVAVTGSEPVVVAPFGRTRDLRGRAVSALTEIHPASRLRQDALGAAVDKASQLLEALAHEQATIPGARALWMVVGGGSEGRVTGAREAVHRLALEGVVTSVFELPDGNQAGWWQVANAGHGQHHRIEGSAAAAVQAELDGLGRVVARLLRLNIRLGEHVQVVRILGSRPLDPGEVRRVKSAEEAMDRRLSETLGVKSDRGEDDDGIQTVIPYFLGGDSHVLVIELWVDQPGVVAEVSLRYKDMVSLENARSLGRVELRAAPSPEVQLHADVRRNIEGLRLAENLATAAHRLRQGDRAGALQVLEDNRRRATRSQDVELNAGFLNLVVPAPAASPAIPPPKAVIDALEAASEQRQGLMNH